MTKANFEKLIKKDISDETFSLYKALWDTYKKIVGDKAHKKDFIKLINVKNSPQDADLKELRQFAKKQLPKLHDKLKSLENRKAEIEQITNWLEKQNFQFSDNYRYEKVSIMRDIKNIKSEIFKLKNSIK